MMKPKPYQQYRESSLFSYQTTIYSTIYLEINLDFLHQEKIGIEGKLQEAASEIIGDPKTKEEEKAKQVEAQISHTIEDIKDEAKSVIG